MKKLILCALLACASPAVASPSSDLATVIEKHWAWHIKNNSLEAVSYGEPISAAHLRDVSLSKADQLAGEASAMANQLRAIPDASLSQSERTNKGVLLRLLGERVEGNAFGQRMMLFSTYSGWHQEFAGLGEQLTLKTKADFENYLRLLGEYPRLNRTALEITKRALTEGYVQPCEAMGGFERTITGTVGGKAEDTRFFEPFKKSKPASIADADWATLKVQAAQTIDTVIRPEFQRFFDVYVNDYKPKCAKSIAVSDLPNGPEYYAFQARSHTTTDLKPSEIHAIGLSEVTRILARMENVAKQARFADRKAMIAELRTNPKYFAKTPEELMSAAAFYAKQIDGLMPRYFNILPRLPYGIKPIPAETAETTTTAYYNPGAAEVGRAGYYYVNTSKLNQRPLWELPALTAHESVPGHHHQIALQQERPLPMFRKHLTGFTAFVEGWALYTEYLGEEMGLYDTPEKMMGRLSFEMWRASRLVVDTGMHSLGWSKARAIAFMKDNTALTDANIEAEVNRYISWPGQALGYKIGEIKIRELRAKAEKALGPKFDLPRFHDAVLSQGAVPLTVLTAQIDSWIAAEKTRK